MTTRRTVILLAALSLSVSLFAQTREDKFPRRERNADEWFVATGRVSIHTVAKNGLLISFDPEKDTARHRIFQFATKQGMPALKIENREGTVEFRGNELVIMTTEDEMFVLSVSEDSNWNLPPGLSSGVRIIGVALNHQIRPVEANKHRATTNAYGDCADAGDCGVEIVTFYDTESTQGGGTCDAGGVGSTSCSITDSGASCSASCGAGFYSCCKRATWGTQQSCKCIKY